MKKEDMEQTKWKIKKFGATINEMEPKKHLPHPLISYCNITINPLISEFIEYTNRTSILWLL